MRMWLRALMVSTGLGLVATSPAYAQSGVELEEIIVTARKRAESLQEAPVSVTAFTAETMASQGVEDVTDVALRTPGMQYGSFGDVKLSPTSLRGIIGNAGSAGADPAVGYYVDEVFVGQGAGASLDLFDIERVEVLRGPQGTLFGRNTIGGVINITTKRPSRTFEAEAMAAYGNYDYRRAAVSVSGPLGERVSAKLAVSGRQRDGVSHNVVLDRDVNTVGDWSARGQVLFELWQGADLLLTAEHREVDQEPLVFETLSYDDARTLPGVLDMLGLPRNTDPYDYRVQADSPSEERLEGQGYAATFRTGLGGVRLTNVLSYRTHEYYSRTDTDRSPLRIIYDGDPEDVWRFSEELRLEGEVGPVEWVAGLYYYRQESKNQSFVEVGADLADLLGEPSLAGLMAGSDAELDTTSKAAFASLTWNVTPQLDVTVGGRYTRDKKRIDYTQSDPLGLLGGDAAIRAGDSWSEFTPNLNIRYRPNDDVMLYGTVSKGFKSGGFNDALGDADGIAFDPEKLWNYELGLKAEMFDRRVALNVAAYYMDWSDIQISQDDPRTTIFDPIILNAGAAHSQGVEVEVFARPTERWTIGGNVSIQEAEYDRGELPSGEPLKKIPFAPAYTVSLNAEHVVPLASGELALFGEVLRRGTTYLTTDNDPDGKVSPYTLLNARVTWRAPGERWSLALWGKNLTDETYKERLFDLSDQDLVGQKFIVLNDPRTYGIELRVSY